MKPQAIHLTPEGLAELKAELNDLNETKIPHIIDRIKNAREQGDLSENSEYHAARDEHAMLQGRVEELEELISRAKVVAKSNTNKVGLGNKVTVEVDSKQHTYHIVGKYEADPSNKKISDESPIGQALLGKKAGEEFEYEAPVGKIIYKIVKIH